ncbi:cysteine-rich and transmembrane domain-containing protein B-like isoform X1 [Abrus precatorius]|uniref:Cysteine-rich and transmembrane domain-containing protein B-like isoform X1 n=1 Tax=Abrus precatorius TaxID=3816 RepID=A0A8B8KG28_ABRPR|nr:cysteine-rich and transmembrane domain-containing protein B-like isoform X1 [Abrus precatorius]
MSHFNNQQDTPAVSYPPQGMANPPASYVTAPPPMGYPSKDGPTAEGYPQQRVPEQTTSRGDGFWKGCCAALCCCCVLDWCF